jgi:hypothetical protein
MKSNSPANACGIFTLKMATAMYAERLGNFQRSMRLMPESSSCTRMIVVLKVKFQTVYKLSDRKETVRETEEAQEAESMGKKKGGQVVSVQHNAKTGIMSGKECLIKY